jgi:hypothetical protein
MSKILYGCPNNTSISPHPVKRIAAQAELMPARNSMNKYLFKCTKCGARLQPIEEVKAHQEKKSKQSSEDIIDFINSLS